MFEVICVCRVLLDKYDLDVQKKHGYLKKLHG